MKCNTITLLSGSSMTGTTTVNSAPIELDQIYGYAIQAAWTGTPNGTIKLQGSCDAPARQTQTSNGGPDSVTVWTDIADSSQNISGSAGNYMWNVNGAFYRFVRLTYTNSSSTGTLSANIVLKG